MSKTPAPFDFDVAVIGGGSGGYAAARTATAHGLRTVVIEGGKEVGGLCILRGCMPTKALLYASDVLHLIRHASTWGLRVKESGFDFAQVMARKTALIEDFANYRRRQLTDGRFAFIRAMARFSDPHTLALNNGQTLTAKHFIISTGSVVSAPPLASLEKAGCLTSDDALALARLPKSLIVLGGGPVAVEFAPFFQRFGVAVTLVQRSERILRDCDLDAAEVLENVFRREGMAVYTCTRLVNAGLCDAGKFVEFTYHGKTVRVEAEEVLLALGRTPNTESLELQKAGVATEGCRIMTNERMQTSAAHIYAAGDCTAPHEIVHIAVQQGEVAAHNIARPEHPRSMDYRLLINVVFTDPQVATVGLTEKEARAHNRSYITASYPFSDHGKSLIMETKDGFVKLLADRTSGEILGGACVGPMAGDLIHEIVAALSKRMTVQELAAMPHYHPTLAEIWTYPAEELAERLR